MAEYVCTVCGWIYEGAEPFEELPEDFCCPMCGAKKGMFKKVEA